MRCSLLLISSPPLYIVPELLSQEPVWDSARSHLRCNLITFIVTSQVLVAFTTSEPALVNDHVIGQEIVTTLGITAKEQVSADVIQQDGW